MLHRRDSMDFHQENCLFFFSPPSPFKNLYPALLCFETFELTVKKDRIFAAVLAYSAGLKGR